MELSLITPIEHLDYTSLLPGRFCLASIALHNPKYLNYFVAASARGYNVILDTGTFEGTILSDEEYLDVMQQIRPSVIVAPDIIGQDTLVGWKRACDFAVRIPLVWKDIVNLPEVMYIPQAQRGQSVALFETAFTRVFESSTVKWIGICRDAIYNVYDKYTHTKDQELNRFYFATHFQSLPIFEQLRKAGKKFHFLGIGDQVHLIKHYWFVDSMDTASFFWQSLIGGEITKNGILPTRMKRPKDYFIRKENISSATKTRIHETCIAASYYANQALDLRKEIEGTRL